MSYYRFLEGMLSGNSFVDTNVKRYLSDPEKNKVNKYKIKQDIPTESGVTNNNKGIYYEM